jgi:hypothetical protein
MTLQPNGAERLMIKTYERDEGGELPAANTYKLIDQLKRPVAALAERRRWAPPQPSFVSAIAESSQQDACDAWNANTHRR